jgi:hypothetical protein
MLDTCHTLASNGPVVKEYWPHFYAHDDKIIPTHSVESTKATDEL